MGQEWEPETKSWLEFCNFKSYKTVFAILSKLSNFTKNLVGNWIIFNDFKLQTVVRYYYCLYLHVQFKFNMKIGLKVVETAKLRECMSKSKISYPTGMSCS